MEEKDESFTEQHGDEEEKENIETAADLVKTKADNKFIARENTAQIQIFIQNANFDKKADIKQVLDLVSVSAGSDKIYDLQKIEDCAEFFSTCKNREYIALAIVIAVFEIVPIGDYTDLKGILSEYLPVVFQTDHEGEQLCVQHTNPYISLNTMLSFIGGKIFIMEDGRQWIGYGEGCEKVLGNIWSQFPDLRKPMVNWLLRINEIFEYKTSCEACQATGAFIRIITEDFQYAQRHVFERLYSSPKNLGLIARLAQELMKDERLKKYMLDMVIEWTETESSWLWKSALLVCVHKYEPAMDRQLHKAVARAVKGKMLRFQNADLRFIALFAGNAKNVRTIIAFVFYNLYQSGSIQGKENLAQIYLKMLRYGYYRVDRNNIDLPFVACDSKEQTGNISVVTDFIMTRYDLYHQLCWTLQAYLEEISGYEVSAETLNHLTAFFYVLTREKYDYRRDIFLFLSELKGSIAKKIYDKLIKIYKTMEER